MTATVTVTVEAAESVPVPDAVAADPDAVPVEVAVPDAEVLVELVASAPVTPPETPQAAIVDSTVFLLVQIKEVPAALTLGTAKH